MPAYATQGDLTAYCQDNPEITVPTGAAADRLLERAEVSVDLVLGPYSLVAATGRKLDPNQLTTAQQGALKRATCAAAEFRLAQGEETLVGSDDGIASLASITFSGRPSPRVAPKMLEELAGHGLIAYAGMPLDPAAAE